MTLAVIRRISFRLPAPTYLVREHGVPLLMYGLLSVGVTWPVVARFTTHVPGESNDVHVALWIMWHVKEAVLGRQPLFELPLLYYPAGATLFTNALGPLAGFLSLPFWLSGPEAAYNGVVLISFLLTGYFMYLLARGLGLSRSVAFFAGLYLLLAPMHIAGIGGHTTKMFLGLLPLTLLGAYRVLDLRQSERGAGKWSLVTALLLLLMLLHTALQFIMSALSIAVFILVALLRAPPRERWRIGRRLLFLAASGGLLVGPLLVLVSQAAYNPALDIDRNLESFVFRPDLLQFVFPPTHSALLGWLTLRLLPTFGIDPGGIETNVFLSWLALPLAVLALRRRSRRAGAWLLLAGIWGVLALGPSLQIFGREIFTQYRLPIMLPYALFTELPGLGFLRTPGRLMQMGFVALGIGAAYGLAYLLERFPRRASAILALAVLILLVESWPRPWVQMQLRPVPPFYERLAMDEELYGVLDLPLAPDDSISALNYSAYYQIYQMVHRKGIAGGYIPRTYHAHPVFPCLFGEQGPHPDFLVDGQPAPCAFHPYYDLPSNNYRYLVLHKPRPDYSVYNTWDSPGWQQAVAFETQYLSGLEPVVDDDFTRAYMMPAAPLASALPATVSPGVNWHALEQAGGHSWRWAQSPATLRLSSPVRQEVVLELAVDRLYTVDGDAPRGQRGELHVALDRHFVAAVTVVAGESARIPLSLAPGVQTVTLTLAGGNFRPIEHGGRDPRALAFAVHHINLRLPDGR